jgi:hypothetical protein
MTWQLHCDDIYGTVRVCILKHLKSEYSGWTFATVGQFRIILRAHAKLDFHESPFEFTPSIARVSTYFFLAVFISLFLLSLSHFFFFSLSRYVILYMFSLVYYLFHIFPPATFECFCR